MVRSGAVKTILRLFAVLLTALLALVLVRQTAFAKTYVITDGDRVVTYTTFATDPAEVLDQAGLTLEQYDTYTTQTGEGVEEITICRSQRVTVDYHGEEMTVTTFGETAGELLSRLNLEVGEYDVLSHAPEAQTSDGMVLRVDSVIKTRETYTAAIPHTITYCNDATIPAGIQRTASCCAPPTCSTSTARRSNGPCSARPSQERPWRRSSPLAPARKRKPPTPMKCR